MQPYQIKRQTKERLKGLRAKDFLARHFSCFDEEKPKQGPDNTWPIAQLCAASENPEAENAKSILSWCLTSLSSSPAARLLVKEAAGQGWRIGIEDLGEQDFHLDVPEKTLLLDGQGLTIEALRRSDYFRNALRVSLIRALRDIWHEIRHGGFDEDYGPEYILMLERVRAADCDVLTILSAWELRSEGHGDLWRHIIGSEEGDMAMAFSNKAERDSSSLFNGEALSEAFKQWYESEDRVNACDHETLDYIDTVMRDCPVGNPFGKRKPTKIGIEILSCLPDKTAYLRGHGEEILSDPVYIGLHDEINQSHLMQIMYDTKVTYVQHVPFRDSDLARKIFPGGEFSSEEETFQKTS